METLPCSRSFACVVEIFFDKWAFSRGSRFWVWISLDRIAKYHFLLLTFSMRTRSEDIFSSVFNCAVVHCVPKYCSALFAIYRYLCMRVMLFAGVAVCKCCCLQVLLVIGAADRRCCWSQVLLASQVLLVAGIACCWSRFAGNVRLLPFKSRSLCYL